jgi:hypothetical protein
MNHDETGTPGTQGASQGNSPKTTRAPKDSSGKSASVARPTRAVVRYTVADRNTKVVTLRAPAPRGKLTVSLTFPVKNRNLVIPEGTAKKFAAHIVELVKAGVLLEPAPPEPELKPVRRSAP